MLYSNIIMLPSAECVLPLHALYSKLTIRIARTPFNNYIGFITERWQRMDIITQ